jgi:transposase
MLALPAQARFFLFGDAVDMRKNFEGLSGIIERAFPGELFVGVFIFLNKQKDRMKVLYWDGDGFAIWYKRLEKGSFLSERGSSKTINRRDFLLLLEGVIPQKIQQRFSLKK